MRWLFQHSISEGNNLFASFVVEDGGATAIEYGLIASLIAVVIIGVLTATGSNLNGVFGTVGNSLGSN
jgi:pilus assembly protein Flp/PilA